ncbi:MAG: polymer-forming cytoskeletal protein [bacterium]
MRLLSVTGAARWVAISILLTGLFAGAGPAAQESSSPPPPDTIFNEINLSDEGVTAVDTSGQDWYFDFDLGAFVQGKPHDLGRPRGPATGPRSEYDDIETRAVNEINPDDFSRRAVLIDYDEYVDGDIVAWGRVTVKGWVKGDIKCYQGRVLVAATGQVDGNIEAPEIIVRDGGKVLGKLSEGQASLELDDFSSTYSADGLIVASILTLSFAFIAFLMVSLMPQQTQRIDDCIRQYRGRCFGLGLLLIFGLPVVFILVIITIVGILLTPLIPFLYVGAVLLGLLAYGRSLGRALWHRRDSERGRIIETMSGVALLLLPWVLVALMLGSVSGVIAGLGIAALVLTIIGHTFIAASGIGAAVLTRYGFRDYTAGRRLQPDSQAPVPAPPPIPEPPVIDSSPIPGVPQPPPLYPHGGATKTDQSRTDNKD